MAGNTIEITLDGRKLEVEPGLTILQVAERQGSRIPTLCHDPRLEPYASCWVCVVRVAGAKGFVPACSTKVRQGMRIVTDEPDVRATRRMALELLLSNHYGDCRAPCTLTCPSNIDVQGYIGLIANHRYREALELIKRDNPFPVAIGCVCPRPCETACRRNLVDEPVGIDWLKRYVADLDLAQGKAGYDPPLAPKTGKRVVVVGAGPAGLSAAYYLAQAGVEVTVLEAEDKPGGMLRYGIPDYRLPQETLDQEIATILRLGVSLKTGVRLGRDVQLAGLREQYDAVILAYGGQPLKFGRNYLIPKPFDYRVLLGEAPAVAGICRDITERTETERRIRESERLAHVGKLTASLAHEIRNPLNAINIIAQRFQHEFTPAEGADEYAQLARTIRSKHPARCSRLRRRGPRRLGLDSPLKSPSVLESRAWRSPAHRSSCPCSSPRSRPRRAPSDLGPRRRARRRP